MSRPRLLLPALAALAGAGLLFGCRAPAPPPAEPEGPRWFEDVTARVGLDFVHDAGPADGKYFMPQIMGSGAALFDFDGDGLLDIYLVNNGGPKGRPNRLYRQRRDGTFQDVSAGSGLDFAGHCMGVAVGDVNNDGRPDVLVTMYGGVRLFLNKGGAFADVTKEAGLDSPAWGTSAAFFDYDRDGWLDLVVVNYVDYDPTWTCSGDTGVADYCHPDQFGGTVTRLFRNAGRAGGVRFEDVTLKSGLGRAPGPGLGVACADFDGDGWPDIFVANDSKPNHLWINRRDGTFQEEAVERGIAYNALGRAAAPAEALGPHWGRYAERNQLFANDGQGGFRDLSAANGPLCGTAGVYRGLCVGDVDGDGALDLLVTAAAGRARLYKNVAPGRGHWLLVRAFDPARQRDAYGAEVTAHAGGRRWRGWALPGLSYACSNDPRVHFGLGAAERVDRIEVLWPDGTREEFDGGPADRKIELRKGAGRRPAGGTR